MLHLILSIAFAQEPLQLELARRVPVTSAESMAMGSAGIGLAWGAKGTFFNPAAPAVQRTNHPGPFGVSGVLSLSSALVLTGQEDRPLTEGLVETRLDLGVGSRLGRFGTGAVFTTLQEAGPQGDLIYSEGHVVGAAQLPFGAVGVGVRLANAALRLPDLPNVSYAGAGFQMGTLITTLDGGVNVGASFRSRVIARRWQDVDWAPETAVAPWEIGFGVSKVDDAPWPRPWPMRVALDLVVEGPVDDAAALEGVLVASEWIATGDTVTMSPRGGLELEVIDERLRVRSGAWREAARLRTLDGTWHATGGLELRVYHFEVGSFSRDLALEFAVDHGAGFTNVNWITLGFWDSGQVEGARPFKP